MTQQIPSAAEVRRALSQYGYPELEDLAARSGVPFHTLRKIRDGETRSPGIVTVGRFWPHLAVPPRAAAKA